MRQISSLFAFNRGLIDPRGLARVDIPKLKMAAEIMTNWIARVLGSMSIRAGTTFLSKTHNNYPQKTVEFIHSNRDTALLCFDQAGGAGVPGGSMGVLVNNVQLTQSAIASPPSFPAFVVGLTGWTNISTTGGTATGSSGSCALLGDGFTAQGAISVAVNCNAGVEQRIQFQVLHNEVHFRVGSATGQQDLLTDTILPPGTYNFGIRPSMGTGYFEFYNTASVVAIMGNVTTTNPTSGNPTQVLLPHSLNVPTMQWDQSADVMYICDGISQQVMAQRRNQIGGGSTNPPDSWAIVTYAPPDGPFQVQNTTGCQMEVNSIKGSGVTLTSSLPHFTPGHVGCLFSLTSNGQDTNDTLTTAGNSGQSILVTGVGVASRQFAISVAITGTIHIQLQQSLDGVTWVVASGGTYTVGTSSDWTATFAGGYSDGLDNQLIYYRLSCITSSGGSAACQLAYNYGSIRGIVRCTAYVGTTQMTVDVLTNCGRYNQLSTIWEEGYWSTFNGFPSAVRLAEGRLWWGGLSTIFGSVSDAYASFDETITGDSGPLIRTIASGPIDIVTWFVPLQRLLFGTPDKEWAISASSLDIPITPSQYNCKPIGTQGSTQVPALQLDNYGLFVDRSNTRLFQLAFNLQIYNYAASSLMLTNPYLGQASAGNWNTDSGIVRLAIQRKPDTRIHCVRSDGVVLVLVFDDAEQVQSWQIFQAAAGGLIEDVAVLPAAEGVLDDYVYWVVNRTIEGATVRTIELMAQEDQTYGGSGSDNILADACLLHSGSTSSITGLTWMAGQQVAVWADGADVGTNDSTVPWSYTYTVDSSGTLTLDATYTNICVGLPYTATWKSAKLGMATNEEGTPLNHPKSVKEIGLVMYNTHSRGIQYSADGSTYYDIPNIQAGVPTFGPIGLPNSYEIIQEYDYDQFSFPGTWEVDSRIWLKAQSPRPVTAMAMSMTLEMG